MPRISEEAHRRLKARVLHLGAVMEAWLPVWRETSEYFLPRRYPWLYIMPQGANSGGHPLVPVNGNRLPNLRNSKLLDSTSTLALRTLTTGMMNGITSPAKPWFKLELEEDTYQEPSHPVNVWLSKATTEMHKCMQRSNFYLAVAIMYAEWCCFGTASIGIYEDTKSAFRCANFPIGSFSIGVDSEGRVNSHARTFSLSLRNLMDKWPEADLPEDLKIKWANKSSEFDQNFPVTIHHLVEPKGRQDLPGVRKSAEWHEVYFIETAEPLIIQAKGLDEFPNVCPRWEVYADDVYGTSPCMEAIPDVIQLQHLTKRVAQGLDKTVDPPMLAHASLAAKPKAFLPGGVTYVSTSDLQQGARPTYQISVPFDQLHLNKQEVQARIREVLFNDLFRMISDLDTVRSASEIDARREEKLVLLGPVLQRFQGEALGPAVERIFGILLRAGKFPPPPPELEGKRLNIAYGGVLADAMRAVGTIPVERWLTLIGSTAQMAPDVIQIPDWEAVIRYYADSIGVPPHLLTPPEVSTEQAAEANQMAQLEQATGIATQLASGAKQLSETDVGGGANALQAMMGGGM